MNKRYQVFISSTQKDLEVERQTIALKLLQGKYIPIGMEQFLSASTTSWELIKRFIDQCDYYVVVVAGKYGSINLEKGRSYTECEYDYAVEKGIPVLGFLHGNPEGLTGTQLEDDSEKKELLRQFRGKIMGNQVSFWTNKDELASLVESSLNREVDSSPAIGWVRGDATPESLEADLKAILEPCKSQGIIKVSTGGIADGQTMAKNLEASKEIRIITTSGTRFLDAYKRSISKAVASRADIRLLLPQPDSDFVKDVAESEREGEGSETRRNEISQEIGEAEGRFKEYLDDARNTYNPTDMGTVTIGYYTTHLRSTLILCDDRWGWLTITLPPRRATETVSLELSQAGADCLLNDCIAHFNRTWKVIESRDNIKMI